jgi:hypothetical protein
VRASEKQVENSIEAWETKSPRTLRQSWLVRPLSLNSFFVVLPYRFDTSAVVTLILRGAGLLLLVILTGIFYSLFISEDRGASLQLLISGLITGYFARLLLRNLTATRGTITRDGVELETLELYGFRLHGPTGQFPLQAFSCVQTERVSPPVFAQGGPHARVTLVGTPGTPDVLVARAASREAGRALGQSLAAALGLPYNEVTAPY